MKLLIMFLLLGFYSQVVAMEAERAGTKKNSMKSLTCYNDCMSQPVENEPIEFRQARCSAACGYLTSQQ
jgi:hypothetical protein